MREWWYGEANRQDDFFISCFILVKDARRGNNPSMSTLHPNQPDVSPQPTSSMFLMTVIDIMC